ncbi:MAG: trypsin-like peptidase domain-containing protein [Acidobacteriota bacterium]
MYQRIEPPVNHFDSRSKSGYARVIILLIAICCLSIGIAVGAIVSGIGRAKSEDNRLSISSAPIAPDVLSGAFARAARDVEPCVAHIRVWESEAYGREGTGSGVIVNPAGFILTNAHVVRRANKIRVKLWDGVETDARVIGIDTQTDLAVIKIESNKPLPVARMGDSDKLTVGDWVLAIGSPFGLEQTVTAGIISAKDRVTDNGSNPFQQFLQTDAAINPGNSGGPLVNLAGEVIGINTQIATSTGGYNGIGFALPSATAVEIYNQLVAEGRVRRGFLGINPQEMSPQIARLNKIADGQGVLVRELTSDTSPAARAGLQSGDVITGINGQKVKNTRELIRRIASLPVGSLATIEYIRVGERRTANVKLEERKEEAEERLNRPLPFDPRNPRRAPEKQEDQQDRSKSRSGLGINAKTLTPELARLQGLDGARGAFVVSVEPGSIADENNLTADDLIVETNNKPVTNQEDFLRITRELKSGDDVVIKVLRKERGPLRRVWIVSFTMP